ncbi:hypothetical protein S40285_00762 [Stachybotrys chlorohalonatus IBT 40285]|uniref:Vacuolar membrane protein n=1 Tax=Stachybotrys chlorohalonatus (strain IBT 40285) TaxID=1283841 RepID=A0A084QRE4_STAC4|nr:hypothetical protein S40285_00762 [Stachybotrys chlorohalonata IBT 40285]
MDRDVLAVAPDVATVTSALQRAAVATVASLVASAVPSAEPTAMSSSADEAPQGECRLMGPFAIFIQIALGGLALLSLVYKRWRERPQRPVKIWFFDVSKQVFGSVLVHIVNVFMSMLTSGRFSIKAEAAAQRMMMMKRADDEYVPNPCSFYLLNLAIDTTIGIPILIILLRLTTGLMSYTRYGQPPESIQSGHYGSPPNVWWWLKQSVIYFIGLFGMKVCVLIFFLMVPSIAKVGDWALRWTEGNEKLQIAFSMMIFPLIMNALQYYIIDSFIKEKEAGHERVPSEDPDHHYDDQAQLIDNERGDDEGPLRKSTSRLARDDSDEEYDLDLSESPYTAAGSSSNHRASAGGVPSDLYPKE